MAGALTIYVVRACACQKFAACSPACPTVSCLSHCIWYRKSSCATTQYTDQSHDACSRDVQIAAWLCCSAASMYEHDRGNTAWVCNADFMVQCKFVARAVKHLASMPLLQRYCHFQAHNSLQQWIANRRAWSSADQDNYTAAIQHQATTCTQLQIKHCNVA